MGAALEQPVRVGTRAGRGATAALAAVLMVPMLSGCVQAGPGDPVATASPSPSSSTSVAPSDTSAPSPTPTATAPMLNPEGTAADNLPYFASIVAAVWAGPENVSGRAYIDALVAAGFDKAAMEVTNDRSTVGNPAESIQFSVLWAGECLVGQVGPATGSPVTVVLRPVGSGRCLVGNTRPIDW